MFSVWVHITWVWIWVSRFCDKKWINHLVCERKKSKRLLEKNIVDARLLSRSGFTAVPLQSAWMSCVEGSCRRLFEETSLAQWPLKCPAEADKRSQVQWKNSHVITTRGRYGVSHYCQESLPAAYSRTNNPLALLYNVKLWKNFLELIWFFFFTLCVESLLVFSCEDGRFIFKLFVLVLQQILRNLRNHIIMLAS